MSRLYRVIVIPVTGHDKLETIVPYLAQQRSAFDQLQLWMNTIDANSFNRCTQAAAAVNWITIVPTSVPINSVDSLFAYYKDCTASNAAYLQLNQDVVWIADGFIDSIFSIREANNPGPLFVHSLAVNHPTFQMTDVDGNGAVTLHHAFVTDPQHWLQNNTPPTLEPTNETVYPCAMSWLGSGLAQLNGVVNAQTFASSNAVVREWWCSLMCTPRQRHIVEASDVPSKYLGMAPPIDPNTVNATGRGR